MRRIVPVVVLALAATLVPQAALAATPAPTLGTDVSSWTCATLPAVSDFAVVQVNDGKPTTVNGCLGPELAWASASFGKGHAPIDLYLNTALPSASQAQWWPRGDRTKAGVKAVSPYGHCTGGDSRACAWVYGDSIARDGMALVPSGYRIGRWWLDLETGKGGNTWSTSVTRNRAVFEGMTAALTARGKKVGLYGIPSHFAQTLGTVPASSRLAALPSWIAGASDQASALRRCTGRGLTAGRVELVQWRVDQATDLDVACGTLTTKQATVKGTFRAKHRLTAKTAKWGPGTVKLTYRWLRAGKPISGATHSTYTLRAADKGHSIRVRITGTESGYTPAVRTSAAHVVHR